ncbi:hypothetical protein ACWEGV_31905, partial [Streptomyces sp. NPDC004976]
GSLPGRHGWCRGRPGAVGPCRIAGAGRSGSRPVLGEPRRVTAAAYGPGDTVHLVLDHASGASSSLTLSLTAPPAAAGAMVELRGDAGITLLPEASEGVVPALTRAADALLTAARTDVPDPRDAAFALRITDILASAEALLRGGTHLS